MIFQFDLLDYDTLIKSLDPTMLYMKAISLKLVFLFFVISLAMEHFKSFTDEPSYLLIVLSLFVYFLLLMIYPIVMKHAYLFCGELSKNIFSDHEFASFLSIMQKKLDSDDVSFWEFTRGKITQILSFVSFFIVSFALNVIGIIRMCLLGFIYCIAPLAFTMVVFKSKYKIINSMFVTIIGVCCWSVVANLLLKVMYVVIGSFYSHDVHIFVIITCNVVVAVFLISTPTITFFLVNAEAITSVNLVNQAYLKMRDNAIVSTLLSQSAMGSINATKSGGANVTTRFSQTMNRLKQFKNPRKKRGET